MNLFDAEAQALYQREIDVARRSSLAILLERIPPGSRVLDVGIGGGALGRQLAAERDCVVDGCTLSKDEAANAAPSYRRVEVADLSAASLDALFAGSSYDVIVCADVLEHLPRPTAVLESCRRLLAESGRLLLSIPNVGYAGLIGELLEGDFRYRTEGLLDRSHVRFFTRRSLLRMLREQRWHVDSVMPVVLDLPDSEFRIRPELLPPAVRRHLLSLPDALTYQFIVEARPAQPGEEIDDALALAPAPNPGASYSLQLYLKSVAGYAEDRKLVSAALIGEQRQSVRFALPAAGEPLTGLRLDPADRPGFLHLHAIRLVDAAGISLWQWDGAVGTLAAGDVHEVVFRTPWTAQQGLVLLLAGDDPYFELPVGESVLGACCGGALIVELSWPMSADYLPFVDEFGRRAAREEWLARELADSRAVQRRQDDELARHADDLAEALARNEQQRAELEILRQAVAERGAQAEALQRQRQALNEARREDESELRRARQDAASLAHALERLRQLRDAAVGRSEESDRRVGDLHASRWTRLGARLARVLGRNGSPLLRDPPRLPDAATRARAAMRAGVSIVIPVFKGLAETQACLESVRRSVSAARLRIVVVNDASPEPAITEWLRQAAAGDARIELIEHAGNEGFVVSANRGMQRHGDDDVILLNSDTEVAGDWIDRLRAAAYREPDIGTATPFSNAATICSYPRFCVDSPLPADLSTAALDRYFAAENGGESIEIPTAVGFCVYIRRDCLDAVGLFDAGRFGRGYGEENDFCMRARAAGWRHVLAADCFVGHAGSVSFGDEKPARVREALALLAELHPQYQRAVDRHILEDPARVARLKVDVARIRASGLPAVLFVSHAGGGGTERHLRELAAALGGRSNVLLLRPAQGAEVALEWLRDGEGFELRFALPQQFDALVQALRALAVAHLHYHHLQGHADCVRQLPAALGATHDVTVHDFHAACPQVTLSDEIGRYCGEYGTQQCEGCLSRRPAPTNASIERWRDGFRPLLAGARQVLAPSDDAAIRIRRYFPDAPLRYAPHLDVNEPPRPPQSRLLGGQRPLRVVVIGAISQIKGADLLEATAALASQRGSRLDFHLLGYAYKPLRTQPETRLTVHGEYREEQLAPLLAAIDADVAWFPALWPETYSYTLSAALLARLPVVASDLGAFPERLSERPWTWICPWYWLSQEWVQFFETLLARHFDPGIAPAPAPSRPVASMPYHYQRDYLHDVRPVASAATLLPSFLEAHGPAKGRSGS
jgi:GT2 family glycosyltransferase/2-polyprenyl-3-methyl-5-hydroxy-6-metoxy-1,4-benzoquinol methylase/glycosyltransferase involved in cell wall biosynthesis